MELELGLSLTNHITPRKTPTSKELDLINYFNSSIKQDYIDDNSSNYSSCESSSANCCDDNGLYKKKRGFDEVESMEFCVKNETLPLLLWDKHPNEDEDKEEYNSLCKSFSFSRNEADEIVGWPPIKTYRKKQNEAQQHGHLRRNIQEVNNGGLRRTLYVKVQMQGCVITRKIDLKLYQCYEGLTSSLLHLFGKGEDRMDDYKLTYQDEDGDWLLAGDVPWSTFITSVQRLKMLRSGD